MGTDLPRSMRTWRTLHPGCAGPERPPPVCRKPQHFRPKKSCCRHAPGKTGENGEPAGATRIPAAARRRSETCGGTRLIRSGRACSSSPRCGASRPSPTPPRCRRPSLQAARGHGGGLPPEGRTPEVSRGGARSRVPVAGRMLCHRRSCGRGARAQGDERCALTGMPAALVGRRAGAPGLRGRHFLPDLPGRLQRY